MNQQTNQGTANSAVIKNAKASFIKTASWQNANVNAIKSTNDLHQRVFFHSNHQIE